MGGRQGRVANRTPGDPLGSTAAGEWLTIALFLLPALLLYLVFVLVPIIQAAHFSLYKWNGLGPLDDFIGLTNYQVALASDLFWQAVEQRPDHRPVAPRSRSRSRSGSRCCSNVGSGGAPIFRLLFFLPYVLSEAITGIVFRLLLQPDALGRLRARSVRTRRLFQDWLGDPTS